MTFHHHRLAARSLGLALAMLEAASQGWAQAESRVEQDLGVHGVH